MGLFDSIFSGKKGASARRIEHASSMVERLKNDGYSIFTTSKQPDRQLVLDYMAQFGIYIVKSPQGLFFIKHLDSSGLEDFQSLTNYRAKIWSRIPIAIPDEEKCLSSAVLGWRIGKGKGFCRFPIISF